MTTLCYRFASISLLSALLIAGQAVHSAPGIAPLPGPFKATYALKAKGIRIGIMDRELAREDPDVWTFRSDSRASGVVGFFRKDRIVELTRWSGSGPQVQPIEYEYRRSGGSKERSVSVRFDRAMQRITTTVNEETWRMDLAPDALDKLIYQVLLMRDLAAGERTLEYRIADGGRMKTYRLITVGTEKIDTPLGIFDTIKLRREKKGSKREATLWCAPALEYLPVKVDYKEKDGNLTTAILQSLSGIAASTTN